MALNWETEISYRTETEKLVCGCDEAGRGPLAGPVVAAAVVLPEGLVIEGLDDSKKLSEKKREKLFDVIVESCVDYGIGICDVSEIEEMNILNASMTAMNRAVAKLKNKPDLALVDGNIVRGFEMRAVPVVKGDAICPSISAASILAKVTRDRMVAELDKDYPEYGFAKHKGYGTKDHREAILKYGPSPIHRMSFLTKILGSKK
jgi:ribonuclease HII